MDIVSAKLNIDSGKLYAYAASAAKLLAPEGEGRAASDRKRLRADYLALRRFHAALAASARCGEEPGAAAEWMLDNFYLIVR